MRRAAASAALFALAVALVPACGGGGSSGGKNTGNPPSVAVATPSGVQVSDIPVAYALFDDESNPVSVVVEYSVDGGATFRPATRAPVGEGTSGLASSPGGVGHVFWWASRLDEVALDAAVSTVRIRITPSDGKVGLADQTDDFEVDNRVAVFRIATLELRDPHVFTQVLAFCVDGTDVLNDGIRDQIQKDGDGDGDLDWTGLLIFRRPTQAAGGGRVDFARGRAAAPFPPDAADLLPDEIPIAAEYENVLEGTVLAPLPGTLKKDAPPYAPAVLSPAAPGFATESFDLDLEVGDASLPLKGVRIGATYVGDPATDLADGLLMGFLSEAAADTILIEGVPLSSLLPGGTGCCASHDDRDAGPDGETSGWWVYFNFTASRVDYEGR